MPRDIRSHRRPDESVHEQPLKLEEQDQLDEFLLLGYADWELLNFMALDGFLTALVLVPGPQMPASWHWTIFGGRDEVELLERLAAAEERGILALLLRHWRTVRRRAFGAGEWTLPDDGEETYMRHTDWAEGFLEGIWRTEEEWAARMSPARCEELLRPVRRIAELPTTEKREPFTTGPALTEEERVALEEQLVGAVRGFWRECRLRRSA